MAGDASAAIGIVLGRPSGVALDAAMTALVVCALGGNAASCLVLSHVLRRMPHAGPAEARLATSWLLVAFRKLPMTGPPRRGRPLGEEAT